MKKENIFIVLMVFSVVIFFLFIWFRENDLQAEAKREIADCARIVSTAVWNYEDKLPLEYLSLTGRKNNFNKISIIMREGGTFIELNDLMNSPVDKFLIGLNFTYHNVIMSEIEYNGVVIGYVKADWYPLAIYSNLLFLLFLSLCLVILWYNLKVKDSATSLEKKVTERTAELIKTNEELEFEIKKRESIEIELIKSKEKSEELNKLKSSLLTNMSHEIRTPMNGILGMASILNERLKEKVFADMAQKIYSSGLRLMNTLGSILDLSELESNTMEINPANYNIASDIFTLLRQYKEIAEEKNLFLKIDIINKDLCAFVDERICRHIILKIVDNAVKYTEKGGITVTVSSEVIDELDWVVIEVSDTGIGIADKDKEIIFDEFKQLSEGISRNYEGTGLGLTLVKKMLKLSKGKLELTSCPGYGSSFRIKFPAAEKLHLISTPDTSYSCFQDDTWLVTENAPYEISELPVALLVEDNEINREVTEIFLKNICILNCTNDGETAVKMAAENKYNIILMDINLGNGIDGIQAAKMIKKISGYEDIPLVALTGYAMSADRNNLLSEGFSHYLAKPFGKEDLVRLVKEIFYEINENNL